MNITFNGRRALVTGAGSGIGRGIAIKLLKCNAKVVALDFNSQALDDLKKQYPEIEIQTVDISKWNETKAVVQKVLPIDLLVNSAGVGITNPFTKAQEAEFDKTFDINVKGLFNVTQCVVEDLLNRNAPGSIVNLSSQASQAALLDHTIYCASKGAVDAFTKCLALELGPKNIRVNTVNPTVVMTELGKKVWSAPEKGGPMLAKIPLGKFAEVEDVEDAVVFLLSDQAKMITGIHMPVDGGFLAT